MNATVTLDPILGATGPVRPAPGALLPPWQRGGWDTLRERQFLAIEVALSRHRGLVSGDDLAQQLRAGCEQPLSMIAKWIVARKIISFEWRAETLIPLFQFESKDLLLRSSVSNVANELRSVFDDWDLLLWFTQPNGWLNETSPIELVQDDEQGVLQAARADRFIARG